MAETTGGSVRKARIFISPPQEGQRNGRTSYSLTDRIATNARLRYNFREGQNFWLVWNEGLNLERDVLGVPRLPWSNARTLSVKYTHTFIF